MSVKRALWCAWAVALPAMFGTYVTLWLVLSPDPNCAFLGLRTNGCAAGTKVAAYLYGIGSAGVGALVRLLVFRALRREVAS